MSRKSPTDAEEARIQHMIKSDPENPEWTKDDFAQAVPFTEAFPAISETMRKKVGGRPRSATPKVAVSLRLDQDVVEKFRATGPGWQTRINKILRQAIKSS